MRKSITDLISLSKFRVKGNSFGMRLNKGILFFFVVESKHLMSPGFQYLSSYLEENKYWTLGAKIMDLIYLVFLDCFITAWSLQRRLSHVFSFHS